MATAAHNQVQLDILAISSSRTLDRAGRDRGQQRRNDGNEVTLQRAKINIARKHAEPREEARFNAFAMRDDFGTTYRIGGGSEKANLFENKIAETNVNTFFNPQTKCDRDNMRFLKRNGQAVPSRNIHVILGGASSNEFAIPVNNVDDMLDYEDGTVDGERFTNPSRLSRIRGAW
jgi:hypothetical protein